MYELTFFDSSLPDFWQGTITCYTDDIKKFEEEWSKLVKDEERIRIIKSAVAGEVLEQSFMDECVDEIDGMAVIVLKDEKAEILKEWDIELNNFTILVQKEVGWQSELRINSMRIFTRCVKYEDMFVRMMSYKIQGIAECEVENEWGMNYLKVNTGGNPFYKYEGKEDMPDGYQSTCFEDYAEEKAESIMWYPMNYFMSLEELLERYDISKPMVSQQDLEVLLRVFAS